MESPHLGRLFWYHVGVLDSRPKTRGECEGRNRPCPWVSCRHHLAPDVLRESFTDDSKDADRLADEVLALSNTCALDVAGSGDVLPPSRVAGLVGLTGARVDQIVRSAGPKIKQGLKESGYSFDLLFNADSRSDESPMSEEPRAKRVNAPPFGADIRARAVSIYHRRTRADAVAFVELATGRTVTGSLVRDWAKRSDKRKKKAGPWSGVRFPLSTVRKALTMYRVELSSGLTTRAAASKVSRSIGITVGYSTLVTWDKIAKEHGIP